MLIEKTLQGFLEELSSSSPAPGGGSVAALAGATAAGLLSMVCNLTIGKEKFRGVEPEMVEILPKAKALSQKLLKDIDLDTLAFNQVMAALKLPKATGEEKKLRAETLEKATKHAVEIPLAVARECLEILRLAVALAYKGNPNAISDVGVAAQMAEAGLQGAVLNVKINLCSLQDERFVQETINQTADYLQEAEKLKQEVMLVVQAKL